MKRLFNRINCCF